MVDSPPATWSNSNTKTSSQRVRRREIVQSDIKEKINLVLTVSVFRQVMLGCRKVIGVMLMSIWGHTRDR